MAMKITDECTACALCEPECPQTAITEGDPVYLIDPELCNECDDIEDGSQCIAVCPVDCIEKA